MIKRRTQYFLALLLVLMTSGPTLAAEAGHVIAKRVTVLPVRVLPRSDRPLFVTESAPGQNIERPDTTPLEQELAKQPELDVVPWSQVLATLRNSVNVAETDALTRSSIELGIDEYKSLKLDKAQKSLLRAQELMHSVLLGIRDPDLASKLYLHLGLVYLEQGDQDQARIALGTMFFYNPGRTFPAGYYSPAVETALTSAYSDFLRLAPLDRPVVDGKTLKSFANNAGISQLFTVVVRQDHPSQVQVHVFDLKRMVPVHNVQLRATSKGLPHPDPFERFISRYVACEIFERFPANPWDRRFRRASLELNGGYHTYGRFPTRSILHNTSIALFVGRGLSPHVAIYGGLNLLTSVEDQNKDLSDRLVSMRFMGGIEFRTRVQRFTFFFSPGAETNIMSGFQVLTSPECKFFGIDHPLCEQSSNVRDSGLQLLMGINASAGMRYHMTNSIYLGVRGIAGMYLVPLSGKKVDYPLGGWTAVGFEF
ncbi:MAG: hypothetical protein CMH54_10615 [Myxococcales bacterium]|nr:hypothetical protein [Myxococcales bacterium]